MKNKLFTCLAACTFALSSAFSVPGGASANAANSATKTNIWPVVATVTCVALGACALVAMSNSQGVHAHAH